MKPMSWNTDLLRRLDAARRTLNDVHSRFRRLVHRDSELLEDSKHAIEKARELLDQSEGPEGRDYWRRRRALERREPPPAGASPGRRRK
jgi:hypothetical protein